MNTIQPPSPINYDEIVTKHLHLNAAIRIREYINNFAITLIMQSKIQASIEQHDEVNKLDVDDAFDHIMRQHKRNRLKEVAKIVGGVLLGVFLPGLATTLPAKDIPATIIYIGIGFLGLLLVLLGILT